MHEIIIKQEQEKKKIYIFENGILVEKYEENQKQKRLEGNIYIGKVQNVLPGMQAAFIDIGENKNTFIHLKDILPKVDETCNNINEELKKAKINELIKPGMPLLVQIKRDSTNIKGARVSTHISLTGKYIVLMPNANFITVSQKIENPIEKERLIKIVKKSLPINCGAIIRTSSQEKNEQEIKKDIEEQISKWNKIEKQKDENNIYPRLIFESDDLIKKILVDMVEKKISKIIVNDKKTLNNVEQVLGEIKRKEVVEVQLRDWEEVSQIYGINTQLEKSNNRKVWLKCGGFITIDKTEALVAIDVNSGKYIGTKNLEQTVYTVNREATIEIAKQLKLRDIGGIIIIDYIDMKEECSKQKIVELLLEELKKDRSKTQVFGFTPLNLLEMTRKHICNKE